VPTGRCRPAEKRNVGIRQARGSIVAFIDDDAFPTEEWLARAVVYFSDKTVAAVGGPASTPGNDPYLAHLSGAVYANPLVSGGYRYRYVPEIVREVDDFPSCNLFVRTEVMNQLGGFKVEFWPGEDTYLCMDIVKKLGRKIFYDPRVHVFHRRRKLFLPHLRQIGRYALHRGYFARHFPDTSRKLSYALPSFFVLGLVFGGVSAFFCPVWRAVYVAGLIFYGALTFLSCARLDPLAWVLTWMGVVLTHLVYGVRFLMGLTARRLPDEVRKFDHPSETPCSPEGN
jgi:cellulose synthase/poly-beta-1,6-N-acetylglucosamine synthase-like glycosyltransferase